MNSVSRKRNPCKNPVCGNTLFTAEYSYDGVAENERPKPVWKCTNCPWTQPRTSRNRKTNRSRSIEAWSAIKAEWKETDAAIEAIVKAGHPSGALLVYTSTWNHHLDKLMMLEKPTNFDIRYHTAQARVELEKAKQWVKEKNL